MADLEIFVLILGDSPASRKMFPVVAPASMYVGVWKGRVHADAPSTLESKPADATLWKLNVPITMAEVDQATGSLGQDLSSIAEKMLPAMYLSDYFPSALSRKSLHAIAVLPSLPSAVDLEIFVFILGDSPASQKMFSVITQEGTSISTWRRRLHAEGSSTFKRCKPADVTLWKLKVPITIAEVDQATGSLGQDLSSIAEEMLPAMFLSDYFPSPPPRKSLHAIAVLPSLPLAGETHGLSEDDHDSEPASKRKKGSRHPGPKAVR